MSDAPNSAAAATSPSANDSPNRTCTWCAHALRNLRGPGREPALRAAPQEGLVAGIRRDGRAAALLRQHEHDVELRAGGAGEPGAERDRVVAGLGGRVADDVTLSGHALASSMMCWAVSRPMRMAPSTCWYPAPAMSLQAKWIGPTGVRRCAP